MNNTRKKLTILGATGSVGRELVTQALEDGYNVTVLVRNPDKLGELRSGVTVVQGDVTDVGAVDRAVDGADAVLSTLGHTKNSPNDVLTVAARNATASMQSHGVKRLVVLANTGVHDSGDHPTLGQRFQGAIMGVVMGQGKQDHEVQAHLIADSGLDWTIVRSTLLSDGPHSGKYRVGQLDNKAGSRIARSDVADFMLACATSNQYLHSMPVVSQ